MSISLDEIHTMHDNLRKTAIDCLELEIDEAIKEATRKVEKSCIVYMKYNLNGQELLDLKRKYTGLNIEQYMDVFEKDVYEIHLSWILPTY